MDYSTMYFFFGLIGLLIWAAILHAIIASATRTKDQITLAKDQLKLLMLLANKQGSTPEEVDNIITTRSLKISSVKNSMEEQYREQQKKMRAKQQPVS